MPELPEVQTVVDSLQKASNKTIISFHFFWKGICFNQNILSLDKLIKNNKIQSISRKGKNIIFDFTKSFLIFQLRMTGRLYLCSELPPSMSYIRCYFILDDNSYLVFEDIRKFGGFYIFKNINQLYSKIGIDPFEKKFTITWLQKNIKKRNRQIKGLLLDQSFICGLGNIYIDEILWSSKIHPLTLCSNLHKKK